MLTQSDMLKEFDLRKKAGDTKMYKKSGRFGLRAAIPGEVIITIIDGKKETTNTAQEDDAVVRGAKGELYIIDGIKASSRYLIVRPLTEEFQEYEASGLIDAYEYTGEPIQFTASWNEVMICEPGDYLASPIIPHGQGVTMEYREPVKHEVYRIERGAFFKTYNQIDYNPENAKP